MEKVDMMIKCRALYLQSIAWILDDNIDIDDSFTILLSSFAMNYVDTYSQLFKLVYDFSHEDGKYVFHEEEEWDETLKAYLKYYFRDFDHVIMLHDEIGFDKVDKISKLAELFCEYLCEVNSINNSLERKH